jgi:putative acetyltransferase
MDIVIRRAEPDDYEALARIFASPKVVAATLQLPYPSVEMWRKRMAEPPEGLYNLVAVVEGEVVGHVGLRTNPTRPRRAHVGDMGIMVRDDWHGKGVGSALMRAALELADRWLNLKRIELTVFTDNEAAIALYNKFGFETEGVGRQYAFRDGAYADVYYMARVRG